MKQAMNNMENKPQVYDDSGFDYALDSILNKKDVATAATYENVVPEQNVINQDEAAKRRSFGRAFVDFFVGFGRGVRSKFVALKKLLRDANGKTMASFGIMGLGQLLNKQIIKGLLFLFIQIGAILYFVFKGAADLAGLFTLGTVQGDPQLGFEGDNSVIMMILGLLAVILLAFYFILYALNIKDAYRTQKKVETGIKPQKFFVEVKEMFDTKLYITGLIIPIVGVLIFNIVPIVFMILIAFTNYGGDIVSKGLLVDWVGFDNFNRLTSLGDFADTFGKILGWNFIWAILSTFLNYFGGLGLALLLNKKIVKGKAFWRVFPILAFAIPGFISLIGFKFMFSYSGPINQILAGAGEARIGFLTVDSKWMARIIGLLVNAWLAIPSMMLMATGILANQNKELYEAAEVDSASKTQQFFKITLPFVLFATTPMLISQFIGNFNNFGVFFFLRSGIFSEGYFNASNTDLLINWLYRLTVDNSYYSIAGALSLIIFAITSIISLTVYILSPAYKQEEQYK